MAKKYSVKFMVIFWAIAILLLTGWYVFLQVKNRNIENLKPFVKIAPVGSERRSEIATLMDIYSKIGNSGEEKNLLVLFQNDLELRPGGGFIGAFGMIKTKNGKIADIQVFDTGNFDKNIPNTETPPTPLTDILGTEAWKMRDSNWSPDFKIDAEKAEYFYKLGGGAESIDGVVAINTQVLNSVLAITGPVKIEGYPGEYRDENAILQLEYQVEKGYAEQGIEKAGRKNIMGELADVLAQKAQTLSLPQQLALAQKIEDHLKQKDIQLFFNDENLQKEIEDIGWGGRVRDFDGDYLMAIDANMLSLKSDYCIKRKMDYSVDLSTDTPQAVLNITYEHTCRAKDWMTTDYRDWLRVYVPKDSYLEEANGQSGDVQYAEELGKKVFGMRVDVPVGETKTITLRYKLPQSLKNNNYQLLVQKQSGSGEVPFQISVKKTDGSDVKAQETLTGDKEFGF
ncbi:MAG TPA: DUF4012 domain-containing protein [Candidatus Saccharimonadales bacterium]|nr:DUF4012 domain-containing protein [Candidatus Saccharimonadales bacterium]